MFEKALRDLRRARRQVEDLARFPLEAFQHVGVMAGAGDPPLDPTLNPRLRGMAAGPCSPGVVRRSGRL